MVEQNAADHVAGTAAGERYDRHDWAGRIILRPRRARGREEDHAQGRAEHKYFSQSDHIVLLSFRSKFVCRGAAEATHRLWSLNRIGERPWRHKRPARYP